MNSEKRKGEVTHTPGISCIIQRARDWGVLLRIMVIGGQAVLGYCGRVRTTKDTDIVSPDEERGHLIQLLKECGFDVEESTFGLRARRQSNGYPDIIHISLGDIADESRGARNILHYPVPESTYKNAIELPLHGLAPNKTSPAPMAPVMPLEDLLITKILPVGRTTDMEDAVLLIATVSDQFSLDDLAVKIRALEELRLAILERLEDLARYILEQKLGRVWLGRAWTPAERDRVLRFIRNLDSKIQ